MVGVACMWNELYKSNNANVEARDLFAGLVCMTSREWSRECLREIHENLWPIRCIILHA